MLKQGNLNRLSEHHKPAFIITVMQQDTLTFPPKGRFKISNNPLDILSVWTSGESSNVPTPHSLAQVEFEPAPPYCEPKELTTTSQPILTSFLPVSARMWASHLALTAPDLTRQNSLFAIVDNFILDAQKMKKPECYVNTWRNFSSD